MTMGRWFREETLPRLDGREDGTGDNEGASTVTLLLALNPRHMF